MINFDEMPSSTRPPRPGNFDEKYDPNRKYTEADFKRWNRSPAQPTITLDRSWSKPNRFCKWPTAPLLNREQWIAGLANQFGWTRGAELGVWQGRTFLFVLETCPQLTLVGVDLWAAQPDNEGPETWSSWEHEQYEIDVRAKAAQFGDRAVIIKDWTTEAANQIEDNSLDFVFIDADHSTEAVRADFEAWAPKVKDDGWILGHDINWPTVRVVVDELLPGYVVGPDNAWGRKKNV